MELYDFIEKWNWYMQILSGFYTASCILYEEAEENEDERATIVNNLWNYNDTVNGKYIEQSVYSDLGYVQNEVTRQAVFENTVYTYDYANALLGQVRDNENGMCLRYDEMPVKAADGYQGFGGEISAIHYVHDIYAPAEVTGKYELELAPVTSALPLLSNTYTAYTVALSDRGDMHDTVFNTVSALAEERLENKLYTYTSEYESYERYQTGIAALSDIESRICQIPSLSLGEYLSEDRYERISQLYGDRLSEVYASENGVNVSEHIAESRLFNSIAEREDYAEHIFSEESESERVVSENILRELSKKEYTSKEQGDCVINVDFKAYATVKDDRDVEKLADVFVNRLKAELTSGAEGIHY